jgi:ketosteroid isomerase-like protein
VSQENVEITSRYFHQVASNLETHRHTPHSYAQDLERDESDPASRTVLDLLHPDVVWINQLGERYEGKLGCARWADELLNASEIYSVGPPEIRDLGGDRVLTTHKVEMKGARSGANASIVVSTVFTVRDGLITAMVEYFSDDEALEAVGLEE